MRRRRAVREDRIAADRVGYTYVRCADAVIAIKGNRVALAGRDSADGVEGGAATAQQQPGCAIAQGGDAVGPRSDQVALNHAAVAARERDAGAITRDQIDGIRAGAADS